MQSYKLKVKREEWKQYDSICFSSKKYHGITQVSAYAMLYMMYFVPVSVIAVSGYVLTRGP